MDFSDYKGIYVVAIPKNGEIQKVTGELIGEAANLAEQLKTVVSVVVIGHQIKDKASDLISLGADWVYTMDSPFLSHYDGVAYQKVLANFFREKKPDTVMFGADSYGRDLAPRVAAELVCGVTADVTELSVETETNLVIWSRPAMGGNIMADIVSPNFRPQVGTIRPGTFRYPEMDPNRKGQVVDVPVTLSADDLGTILKEVIPEMADDNPVEDAKVIVSGGRGFHSAEEWKQLHELAGLLGASVGCSRPIAELGWEAKSHQIGQTGKGVAPKVYFAFGISGAMQHMCAVNADVLVAVNRDAKAPIMEIADYAVVADLKEFIPVFIEKIKAMKAEKH